MKNRFKLFVKHSAFTLMEVIIALTVVGLIAALVMPAVVTRYQTGVMEKAFNKQITSMIGALEVLPTQEGVMEFYNSSMHLDEASSGDYENSSGKFLKKYFKLTRYCGSDPRLCFPSKYTEFSKSNGKREVTPLRTSFDGSCGVLKNGMSICIRPQIGDGNITGYIDVNGKSSPNVLGRDLREFTITPKGANKMVLGSTGTLWDTDDECNDTSKYDSKCCNRWLNDTDLWKKVSDPNKKNCCDIKKAAGTLDNDGVCCQFYNKKGISVSECSLACAPEPKSPSDVCCGDAAWDDDLHNNYYCACDMANPSAKCCNRAYFDSIHHLWNEEYKDKCCMISSFKNLPNSPCPKDDEDAPSCTISAGNISCCEKYRDAGLFARLDNSYKRVCCSNNSFGVANSCFNSSGGACPAVCTAGCKNQPLCKPVYSSHQISKCFDYTVSCSLGTTDTQCSLTISQTYPEEPMANLEPSSYGLEASGYSGGVSSRPNSNDGPFLTFSSGYNKTYYFQGSRQYAQVYIVRVSDKKKFSNNLITQSGTLHVCDGYYTKLITEGYEPK